MRFPGRHAGITAVVVGPRLRTVKSASVYSGMATVRTWWRISPPNSRCWKSICRHIVNDALELTQLVAGRYQGKWGRRRIAKTSRFWALIIALGQGHGRRLAQFNAIVPFVSLESAS